MHGSLNFLKNNAHVWQLLALAAMALTSFGCSSSKESAEAVEPATLNDFLAKYEPSFTPSEYNPDVTLLQASEQQQYATLHAASVYTTAVPETIQGFRIQVILTSEIDRANAVRDSLESLLPEDWVFIAYDAPYYKVRVGNYSERATANPTLKKLNILGYKEAWVVPDNILKNPPPKPPSGEFIEPKRSNGNQH